MIDSTNHKTAIEAILFAVGDSVDIKSLALALEIDFDKTRAIIDELKCEYEEYKRGVDLVYVEDSVRLCSRKEYHDFIARLINKQKNYKLSSVALETLSIIAYKQPVTKAEIERIRGVKSDYAVNQLIEFGIVEEKGRSTAPGHPILFGTTNEFLLSFGLKNIKDLPTPEKHLLEEFSIEAKKELNYFEENENIDISDYDILSDDFKDEKKGE